MGETAEDIIDGTACQLCGCYFKDDEGNLYTHDYPVVCEDCWKDLKKKEKKQYQKAIHKTF